MIRSNYIISRVALFLLFVGFSTLALNPLVRWGIVRTGQSITGARVDIAKVRSALMNGYVILENVQAADPRYPTKNLFEAQHVRLNVDTDALKQRRFVITDGQATGFRLGTDRATPGKLDDKPHTEYDAALVEQFDIAARQWLNTATRIINVDVTDDLQSVAIAKQLASRWPTEQERIDAHSAYVRDRIAQIQKLIDESGENPLRNLHPYQQAIGELESLQNEAFEITGGMNRLRQQLLMDQNTIRDARKQDAAYLAQQRQIGVLPAEQLSEYLVGPELKDQVRTVLDWIRWGRKQIPTGAGVPLAHRSCGEFIYFPGIERTPHTVIQKLNFVGNGVFGGEPVEIEGMVQGLSSHPELSSAPVKLAIKTVGGATLSIEAMSDMRGELPRDHVLISCPNLPSQRRTLGQAEALAVNVSPGTTQLRVCMEIVGDSIEGEVVMRQDGVLLTPQLASSFAGDQISELVAVSLAGVDEMETCARLSGRMDDPVCGLESNLGPTLASGIARVVEGAARESQQRALAAKYREIDALIGSYDQIYEQKSRELLTQFEARRDQIERIQEIIASRVEQNDGVTDENWPLRETLRR